jgi:signal transduction histidine kinase/CheY-like chemotaxis protein
VSERYALRHEVARQHDELQETLASLLDTIPVGILIADGDGHPRLVNRVAQDLLGIHALTPLCRWAEHGVLLYPDGSRPAAGALATERTLADGIARRDIEMHVVGAGAEPVPILLNTDALHDARGRVVEVCLTFTNISERRHIERQLQHAQKMEAVGALAGGIAHDFNNILCAVTGYSELALGRVNGDENLRRLVTEIKRAGSRAATLTRQLLSFSRNEALAPRTVDLDEAVADMEGMLRRLIGEDIQLRTEASESAPAIHADPGQVEQVLLNLVINASDAMPAGGAVEVRTDSVQVRRGGPVSSGSMPPGRYAVLSVTDDGCGMDESTLMHVFEPFFTTKPRGKGTGLGLSTVYGIVKQSRGYIDVQSAPGLGSIFQVYWPCVEARPEAHPAPRADAVRARGREVILLVEDEGTVRRLLREILESAQYEVIEAASGPEAEELFHRRGEEVDLLVTDVVMPELNGRELAGRLQRVRPDLKVLFVSGYTDDALAHYGIVDGETAFLPKPFDARTLTRKVRELLDHVPEDGIGSVCA